MSKSVIMQPNGLFAVWCSIGDEFVALDATEEEVERRWIGQAVERGIADASRAMKRARGELPGEAAFTLEECVRRPLDKNPKGELLALAEERLEDGER